jgi:uncharacterized membrane protein YdjX (TVP38/TMEM64 family)
MVRREGPTVPQRGAHGAYDDRHSYYSAYDGNDDEQSLLSKICQVCFTVVMVALLIAIGIDLFTTEYVLHWLEAFVVKLEGYGVIMGAIVLIGMTTIGVVSNFPSTFLAGCSGYLMNYQLGFVWGVILGTAINLVGYLIGASICYILALNVFKSMILSVGEKYEVFRRVELAINKKDFTLNCLIRLSPVMPAFLINYGLPCIGSRFVPYFWGCLFGTLPYSLLFAVAGAELTNASDLANISDSLPAWASTALPIIGVGVILLLCWLLYKYSNDALNEMLHGEEEKLRVTRVAYDDIFDADVRIPSESDSLLGFKQAKVSVRPSGESIRRGEANNRIII